MYLHNLANNCYVYLIVIDNSTQLPMILFSGIQTNYRYFIGSVIFSFPHYKRTRSVEKEMTDLSALFAAASKLGRLTCISFTTVNGRRKVLHLRYVNVSSQ